MLSKKRRRIEPPTIHPRNKYSETRPDFNLLASLYPSFQPYVFYSRDGRPRIDWTDFNATRELTRVLLHHDHGINWQPTVATFSNAGETTQCHEIHPDHQVYPNVLMGVRKPALFCRWIPDGQLCPTIPNRSNYIHWIEDLLSSDFVAEMDSCGDGVRGFDIGTGANCIYPLLGASILGWSFVGSDVTDVALEWARRNVEGNSHLSELIEIRKAGENLPREEETVDQLVSSGTALNSEEDTDKDSCTAGNEDAISDEKISSGELPVLVGVVRDGEQFDFCMCNPPFFESIEEAGRNPKTSCGGTYEEMVFPGGEQAFITRIIQDSVMLKQSFRWFTSMVGRKESLKQLARKLREVGVSIVKTTEFVQGHTSRWGLGWSFMSPTKKISSHVPENNHQSFMLEGLGRQFGAIHVLKSVESFFLASGASCKSNLSSFIVDVTASNEHFDAILKDGLRISDESVRQFICDGSNGSNSLPCPLSELCFRVTVFEQIPGTLLVRGSLLHRQSPLSGMFAAILQRLEVALKKEISGKFKR